MTWEAVGKSAGGQDFLKIEAGSKVKLHVLSEEPHSYRSVFFQDIQRSAIITDETAGLISDPKSIRPQHSFVVAMEDGSVKVWQMGNRLAEQVKGVYDTYGSLAEVDLVVSRTGTDKNTKYLVTPVPVSIDISGIDMATLPNLEELAAPTSEEDIEHLKAGIDPSSLEETAPAAQEDKAEAEPEVTEAEEAPAPKALPKAKPPIKMGVGAAGTPDPKAPVIRECMLLLSKSAKYKTIQARQALLKKFAPGKTTVGTLSLPELLKLRNELKK